MPNPLNPALYAQLIRVFGHVRIGNEGECMTARYQKSIITGAQTLDVTYNGEVYLVCCPLCNDTRFRLQINHTWGRRDETGRRRLGLVHCFNQGCFDSYQKREDLLTDLTEIDGVLDNARILPGVMTDPNNLRDAFPPGTVKPLHELPPDHPANRYLAGRFYDPERLGRFYDVGYCSDSRFWLARNRIYVPVYKKGALKGWQMRYVGDMDWKSPHAVPKWWTDPGMKKSLLLYNLDEASTWRTGVITEGPGDVWGFGPMAVCTFGASMSIWQRREFAATFRRGSAVLLYDPDVVTNPQMAKSYDKLCVAFRDKFKEGFAPVVLPRGYDPGSMERGLMRRFVEREALGLGVKVRWERK